MRLTKLMAEGLRAADLERGELNNVGMMTFDGLRRRGLITGKYLVTSTQGGRFPWYSQVKLTEAGMRAARTLQGYKQGL
jgi:hypothetical protein